MTFYLDTNAWSNISMLLINDQQRYNRLLDYINAKESIIIFYSDTNVIETLRRANTEHIQNDYNCYRDFARCRLVNIHGKVEIIDPELVRVRIDNEKAIYDSLKPLFDTYVEKRLTANDKMPKTSNRMFDKRELNNIDHKDIIPELERRIDEQMEAQPKKEIDRGIVFDEKQLNSIILGNVRNATKAFEKMPGYIEKVEDFTKDAGKYIQSIMDESFKKISIASNGQIGKDPFTSIDKAIDNKKYETGIFTALMGAFQYFPDDQQLLRKKGVSTDIDDIAHINCAVNCDYFVTNDKKLTKRALAAIEKTKIDMKIIGIVDFYNIIEEKF